MIVSPPKKMEAIECPECKKKSFYCKDCKTINHFIRKTNAAISEIMRITNQMYEYRFKEFKDNEIEISAKEAEYIYQKCSKAEFLLRTSNAFLQDSKKIGREITSTSCADWIE